MFKITRFFLTAIAGLALLSGCDSVVGLDGSPTGVALLSPSGAEVARYTTSGGGSSQGELVVPAGSTIRYRVVVLSGLGVETEIDGQEYSISDPALVIPRAAQVSIQQPDRISVTGLEARTTTLRFTLRRNGMTQFIADDIGVRVQG